jgi:hypothetical protein
MNQAQLMIDPSHMLTDRFDSDIVEKLTPNQSPNKQYPTSRKCIGQLILNFSSDRKVVQRLGNLLIVDAFSQSIHALFHGKHKCGGEWSVIRCGEGAQHTKLHFSKHLRHTYGCVLIHKRMLRHATRVFAASLRGGERGVRSGWRPRPNDRVSQV